MRPTPETMLPDFYGTVAEDMLAYCRAAPGRIWVDLGSGTGGIGLALLARLPVSRLIFMDPDSQALHQALARAHQHGYGTRTMTVAGSAETIPLQDESVDAVVSRGSVYFWQDRARGIAQIWRVLRPGGRAMIGGGLGSGYPRWARSQFIQRRRDSMAAKGPHAAREFAAARSPETFRRLATEAGLPDFIVAGGGDLEPHDPDSGIGIWLQFSKTHAT